MPRSTQPTPMEGIPLVCKQLLRVCATCVAASFPAQFRITFSIRVAGYFPTRRVRTSPNTF